jgi:hypothetical protein
MSVTLSEVKRAARAHHAPLAGESAGYLVLALADQVLSAPRLIDGSDVQLTDDGGLRVLRGQASSDADAELSLRRALDELLLVASSGSAALMRAGRRATPIGLPALVKELEAALIPVNRGAARRALARLQRETARAVASGILPELSEEKSPQPAPVVRVEAKPAGLETKPIEAVISEVAAEQDEPETRAIAVPVAVVAVEAPDANSNFDGVVSALCDEPTPTQLEESPSDALTVALDVRALSPAEAAETILFEEDVEFLDEEPSDALTVVRGVQVAPLAASEEEPQLVELPQEACTRPEPVILRQSQRPAAPDARALEVTSTLEMLPRTPTLGSLAAALPVLAPELIAELSRCEAEEVARHAQEPDPDAGPSLACVAACAALEECTEPMPEVLPLTHGVAIVPSRQSEVSELLAGFQVATDETHQGLCRAIKELAELDLTPAPFGALIR